MRRRSNRKRAVSVSDEHPDRGLRAPRLLQRLRLRNVLFLLLLLSGIIPLAILSGRLVADYQGVLKDQETVLLTQSAQVLAGDLSDDLARRSEQLRQLGLGLVAQPSTSPMVERFAATWVDAYLQQFLDYNPDVLDLRVVDSQGRGRGTRLHDINARVVETVDEALSSALAGEDTVYRFAVLSEAQEPAVMVAVSLKTPDDQHFAIGAVVRIGLEPPVGDAEGAEEVFLIDRDGEFLWSGGFRPETPQIELALRQSDLIPDFTRSISVTREYALKVGGRKVPTLARVVPVAETGWRVVAHKPAALAFREVRRVFTKVLYASLLLVVVAGVFALLAARWLSQPIQRLADTTHQIAAGHLDRRVETDGLGRELSELAHDFNRMSDYVANHIEQLQRAARANRELFISSIRAFAAAIDAKDPYTRGHSERVAAYSRAIASFLGVSKDVQERVWVSAVLHDIGKIGVHDQVLKKGGVLTEEELAEMKRHPIIGAEIVEPIAELEQMIPGIRWHHEAWNGSGYPDGLTKDQIPLMARIIGVADTFDAMTTNRPYQQAFASNYALETIERLAGSKFDPKIVTAFLLAFRGGHIESARREAETASTSTGSTAMMRDAVGA